MENKEAAGLLFVPEDALFVLGQGITVDSYRVKEGDSAHTHKIDRYFGLCSSGCDEPDDYLCC